jgi:hypothetical protein
LSNEPNTGIVVAVNELPGDGLHVKLLASVVLHPWQHYQGQPIGLSKGIYNTETKTTRKGNIVVDIAIHFAGSAEKSSLL